MTPARVLCVVVVAALSPSCLVDPIDLNDRKCDEEHQCVDGYTCIEKVCVKDDDDPDSSG